MTTKAQLNASKKYISSLDEIKIRIPKGEKDKIKAYAESKGMSLNSFIRSLIENEMNNTDKD